MESIGQRFKTARERKRVSLSQAAAKTRIKVQVLEAMEQDNFSKIPAPAYSRGFIRMYAEFLGLESGPMVQEFNSLQPAKGRDGEATPRKPEPKQAPPAVRERDAEAEAPVAEQQAVPAGAPFSAASLRRAAYLVGGVILLIVVVGLFTRGSPEGAAKDEPAQPVAPKRDLSALVAEPADPYIDVSAASEQP